MIFDLFIPEKLGSYYFFHKRIVGIEITKTTVFGTQILLAGSTITIEKFIQESIDLDTTRSYEERTQEAVNRLVAQCASDASLYLSISAGQTIFKEIQLPFLEWDKIGMVINYEADQMLPIDINSVIIDFIITRHYISEKKSDVMLAAVRKESIAENNRYFQDQTKELEKIIVDIFSLYALYQEMHKYDGTALRAEMVMSIEQQYTKLFFVVDGQLRLIRTIQKGLFHIAKQVAQERGIAVGEALEEIIRFGFHKNGNNAYEKSFQDAIDKFLQDLSFTINAFFAHIKQEIPLNQISLLGVGSDIPQIDEYIAKKLQVPCVLFDIQRLLRNKNIILKEGMQIPRSHIISLSTAFPSAITEHCTLKKQEFATKRHTLFYKQFITALVLSVLTIGIIVGAYLWQRRSLSKKIQTMETAVVKQINTLHLSEKKRIKDALNEAQDKVQKEEELWFGFSRQRRFSFLETLQTLSTAIDRKGLSLIVRKLIINTNDIQFEGEVRDHDSLRRLERALRKSQLFTTVPALQELSFNEKLPLKKNNEEAQ